MRKIMEQLLVLQKLQFDTRSQTSESKAEMAKLRDKVPTPILAHYERLVSRGKKGVAIARAGVCSECHLLITSGRLISLVYTDEVQLCDNCGRYLYLPEDEPIGLSQPKPAPPAPTRRPSRKTVHHVA
jgi:predicted  nucleic acid-binding Zn-ribbon protein